MTDSGPYFRGDDHYTTLSGGTGRREITLLRVKGGHITVTDLLLLTHENSFNLGNGGEEEKLDP